jgi:hypothetical protein
MSATDQARLQSGARKVPTVTRYEAYLPRSRSGSFAGTHSECYRDYSARAVDAKRKSSYVMSINFSTLTAG